MMALKTNLALLICFTASGSVFAQQSSIDELKELGQLKIGRWSSKITLINDWKDLGFKKGQVVNGYTRFEWKSDGRAFIEQEVLGNSIETTFYFFDATEKRIRSVRIGSNGTSSIAVWWKKNGKWHWKIESATTGTGGNLTGEGVSLFENGGKKMIRDGTVFVDGKKLPHYHDEYTKVSDR